MNYGRRWAAFLLILMCVFGAAGRAEEADYKDRTVWECSVCGGRSDWRYCPWCGAGKMKMMIQCPECKMMYDRAMHYLFCKACGALLEPVDTTGLSDIEAVEKRLELFMLYWRPNKTTRMLEVCAPSWTEQVEETGDEPKVVLFGLLQNRTPVEYELVSRAFSPEGDSCETEMKCLINRHNGKDSTWFRLTVEMRKEDGEWFVDPTTLQAEQLD